MRVAVAGLGFTRMAVDVWGSNFDELVLSLDVGDESLVDGDRLLVIRGWLLIDRDKSLVMGDQLPIIGDSLLIAKDNSPVAGD